MVSRRAVVTTSWDDGDVMDLRLAELLRAHSLKATFYIPIQPYRKQTLSPSHLRGLAQEGFEIGAHSVSHQLLHGLSPEQLAREIHPCKPILEDIIGKEVRMFCYPQGRFDSNTVRVLKQAGYCGARTVRMLSTRPEFDSFQMPTTVQSFPHPRSAYLKNATRATNVEAFCAFLTLRSVLGNWVELGKRLFDSVLENGGIWHLYGHSWEIEEWGLWQGLKELLTYVSRHGGIDYVTNSELASSSTLREREGVARA